MGVAVGGRIDDDLHAFRARRRGTVGAPVLRAEIDAGRGSKLAVLDRVKLGPVIVRKEDIVVRKVKTRCSHMSKESDSRQRTVCGAQRGHGAHGIITEQACRQGARVAIHHYAVGAQPFA